MPESSDVRLLPWYISSHPFDVRIGGVQADFPPGFEEKLRRALKEIEKIIVEVDKL
ncbi:hypothetical protein LCGC14_3147510, partial [marine sediment metagenome]